MSSGRGTGRLSARSRRKAEGKVGLWKRIAWRMQADVAADQPAERGHLQAKLKRPVTVMPPRRKPDLPAPGTVITRRWRGRDLELCVLDAGFELDGVVHRTLSAAAKSVTGAHWSGHLFWNLKPRKRGKK